MSSRRATGATVISSFVLASCVVAPGPVDLAGDESSTCAPVRRGESALLGLVLTAPSSPATLVEMHLQDVHGMEVLDQYVVPLTDDALLIAPRPPANFPPRESRLPLRGAVLEADTPYNVVTQVSRTSDDGAFGTSMTLTYRVGPHRYTTSANLSYELEDRCF